MNIATNNKGIALIAVMVMVLVVTIFAVTAAKLSTSEKWLSSNYHFTRKAYYAADAGVLDGISRLVNEQVKDTARTSTTWGVNQKFYSSGFSNEFTITHLLNSTGTSVVNDSAGRPYYAIHPTGWDNPSKNAEKTIEAIVSVKITNAYNSAMVACNNINVGGSGKIDSYDSANGAYGGTNIGSNGDIRTCNANANISISTVVGGDITATGTVYAPQATGTITENAAITNCDPLDINSYMSEKFASAPASAGNLNTDATLVSGASYHYDSIQLNGKKVDITGSPGTTINIFVDSSVKITGANGYISVPDGVTLNIYIKGEVDMSGMGIITSSASKDATKINLFSNYAGMSSLQGSADFVGTFYAPYTDVKLAGGGGIYGSVRGKTITKTGNNDFHYDDALGRVDVGSVISAYYKEVSTERKKQR